MQPWTKIKNVGNEDDTDGAGKGDGNGEYSQDKVENAKKHLLESDDLLQQLQEKFSKFVINSLYPFW